MHDTSIFCGKYFAELYSAPSLKVVDIGGLDINGSLKEYFTETEFICVDIEEHESVNIVIPPGSKLPFETGSIDIVVSTSCFEHDPCFWITFKEMCRIVKLDGFIYVNAPSNGLYHKHPGDNWRFYPDSAQALAHWSSYKMNDEIVYPVKIEETFYIYPKNDVWTDFVCIWKRTEEKQTKIIVSDDLKTQITPLKQRLLDNGFSIGADITQLPNIVEAEI